MAHFHHAPGNLSIGASSASVGLRVVIEQGNLRMLFLTLPSTLSFGNVLSGLGIPASDFDSSDVLTVANSSVMYVPMVNGQTGAHHNGAASLMCVSGLLHALQ